MNKHEINSYDKTFLKSLNYGKMIPMAVIKNYNEDTKSAFERQVNSLLDRCAEDDINFGSVKLGEDDYYIAGCSDEFTLLNLISQGYNLGHVITEDDERLVCGVFDSGKNIREPGVATIMVFQEKSNADKNAIKNLAKKFSSDVTKKEDFELFLTTKGKENEIHIRQTGAGELWGLSVKAKTLSLNILSGYKSHIKNVRRVELGGQAYRNRIDGSSYGIAKNNMGKVDRTLEQEALKFRAEREITAEDLREILQSDVGEDRVVASVLKNPYVSYDNIRRICNETKSARDSGCEIVSMLGKNGDKFLLFAVDKDKASVFVRGAVKIEAKLLRSSGKGFTIKMMNIDNNGKIMPVERRLVGRLETRSALHIEEMNNRFANDEIFARISPEIIRYNSRSCGVYIKDAPRAEITDSRVEKAVQQVRYEIVNSGMKYELTDAYGEPLSKRECDSIVKNSKKSACVIQTSATSQAKQ